MIYLDYAATAPMRPGAVRAMEDALTSTFGNASASYSVARKARALLDESRAILAESIHADFSEIILTSGGSESDNQALIAGLEETAKAGKPRLITSSIEHHAVLHTADYLRDRGFPVTILPVNQEGILAPKVLEEALLSHPDTGIVSVMWANNEVGTIEPIRELAELAISHGCLFHTDAVQAYGKLPIDVREVPVTFLSASAHKIGGPKGIGFLYIKKGTRIGSLIHGGTQERGRRAGTENVPAAAGFAAAVRESEKERQIWEERERSLQQYFKDSLLAAFPEECYWNGPDPGPCRLPGNLNISFPGLVTDAMLMNLDLAGICASGGSACTTGLPEPSHVILAMIDDPVRAKGTLRFTLGPETTKEEIDRTLEALRDIIPRLRRAQKSGMS
ncbi:MAG: cysteine desulfurase family protein [Lachnospiraceae bacterium]